MGFVGYALARSGLADSHVKNFLPIMVVRITLPLFLFSTTVRGYTRQDLADLTSWVGLGTLTVFLTFAVSLLAARLIRPQGRRRGIFCASFAASNTMYIGVPVNLALFGQQALNPAMAYFLANGIFFWTVGNYLMSLDGQKGRVPLVSLETVKRLLPPPMIGFLLGIAAVMAGIKVPDFLLNASASIGAMNTPLAVIYIGLGFYGLSLKSLKPWPEIAAVLSGRFIICPAITLAVCLLSHSPVLMTQVFTIQASLPVLAAASIMAGYYQSDPDYAAVLVSLSTALALVTIPVYRVLAAYI
jgi:predicted permease